MAQAFTLLQAKVDLSEYAEYASVFLGRKGGNIGKALTGPGNNYLQIGGLILKRLVDHHDR